VRVDSDFSADAPQMPLETGWTSHRADQMQEHSADRIFGKGCHLLTRTDTSRVGFSFRKRRREENPFSLA
jgi:hypothetical protein